VVLCAVMRSRVSCLIGTRRVLSLQKGVYYCNRLNDMQSLKRWMTLKQVNPDKQSHVCILHWATSRSIFGISSGIRNGFVTTSSYTRFVNSASSHKSNDSLRSGVDLPCQLPGPVFAARSLRLPKLLLSECECIWSLRVVTCEYYARTLDLP